MDSLLAQIDPTDVHFRKQQQQFIRNSILPYKVELLPREINTQYSEYKGVLFQDSIFLFNAMRAQNFYSQDPLFGVAWSADIYQSIKGEYGYTQAKILSKKLLQRDYYNTNFSIDSSGNTLFFVRVHKKATQQKGIIWQTNRVNGVWQKPIQLPEVINYPNANNNFPHWVEMEDYGVLYFCSDRPNGYGGMDIWYSIVRDGVFEPPVNLGPVVNTTGDEITPFFDSQHKVLYFSSDEHLGIGGFDIFYTEGALSQWSTPTNMGVPINSEDNDFYLTLYGDGKKGYFSSNRENVFWGSENKCCNDLYHFSLLLSQDVDTAYVKENVLEEMDSFRSVFLYFDNDQPDARSTRNHTKVSYERAFLDYMSRKEQFLSYQEDDHQKEEMERFFLYEVAGGYQQLIHLTEKMITYLQKGDTVQVAIYGFASKLHNSTYNLHLSERRIVSLYNFWRNYGNGVLVPYMSSPQGQLQIKTFAKGSEESMESSLEPYVHNTIYSISASRARRIEIRSVEVRPKKKK